MFVASQEAAIALVNSRNSIFIEALSTTTTALHGGEFVLLKNGNVGRLLHVNTEWDRPILFQIYPTAAPEQALVPLHPHIVLLVPERTAGSRITKIEQQSIAEIFFLFHANQVTSHTFFPNGIIICAYLFEFQKEDRTLVEIASNCNNNTGAADDDFMIGRLTYSAIELFLSVKRFRALHLIHYPDSS